MRILTTLLIKDLTLIFRDKRGIMSVLFFTALVSLLLFFSLGALPIDRGTIVMAVIWLSTLFGGTLQLNRTFDYEREESVLDGLKMIPGVMGKVYLSKFIVGTLMLFLVIVFATVFSCVLFNYSGGFRFLLPVTLGAVSMSALGTIFSSMVMTHHKKDSLLPALLYPLMAPIVIAVIKASDPAEANGIPWLNMIIAFDVMYLTASFLIFESIMDE